MDTYRNLKEMVQCKMMSRNWYLERVLVPDDHSVNDKILSNN